VLDPFFGTGTTGAVAKKLGRHFIGIERNPNYIRIAEERIATIEPAPEEALNIPNPRQQKRIPFGMLLEAGFLQPGQKLYFVKNAFTATIMADGSLRCGKVSGSIHSVARVLIGDKPANGWDCWLFDDGSGMRVPIDFIRKKIQTESDKGKSL
jgi:modification methylase